MHTTPFDPIHLRAMDIQPMQSWIADAASGDYGAAMARGVSQTVWDGDRPIACMGEVLLWPGNGEVWTVFAREIGTQMTYVLRSTLRLMASVSTRRHHAYVEDGHADGMRWMMKLGFHVEGRLVAHFPNGKDAFLFARVREAT